MKNVFNWVFKQRDIDAQVISLMIAAALTGFIKDLSTGFIDPLVNGTFRISDNDVQNVGPYKFKFQLLLNGIIRALFILVLVYQFALLTKSL